MSRERPPAGPVSWEALAAELAATRAGEEDRADPRTWDAVAAELADRVGGRRLAAAEPAPVAEPPPLAPPERPGEPPAEGTAPEDAAPEDAAPEGIAPEGEGPGPGSEPEPDPVALRGGLEALLFVADGPLDEATLGAALGCSPRWVGPALAGLAADYDARRAGMTLRRVGEAWRLYTREEYAPLVERHLVDGQRGRLTQAALETLAVIAYRQPVTRARIAAIRGVGVDGVMRTLLTRGLVHGVGNDPGSGAGLYATTPLFLERLGLGDLDELPDLGPLLPEASALLDEHPDS